MKILLLADINSAHTRRWGEALVAKRVQLGIFSLNPANDDWPQRHGVTAYSGGIPEAKTKGGMWSKIGYLFSARRARAAIADFRPDVVHAHYASSYGLLARRTGSPYLLSAWGSDVFDFPHRHPLNRRMVVRSLKKATHIMATGSALAEEVRRLCGREATIIPFGIDTERFKPENRADRGAPFTFVIVKSLEPVCGVDAAIRGLGQLEHDARLVIAGVGTQEAELKQLTVSLGIADKVEFRGWIENRDVPALLNSADCFLNLSRREGFGVSILEAWACGLPVIATRTHGAEELIEADQDGLLVAIDDLEGIARAMNTMITQPDRRYAMAERGLAKAREQYAWKRCVRRMLDVYESFLTDRN